MTAQHPPMELTKLPTGIVGFDQIANGGIPKGRSTLMSGTAGSGKTVMALQFLLAGVRDYGENGVFVTFEEAPADLMQNVRSFGWDLEGLVKPKQIAVVDATPEPGEDTHGRRALRPVGAAGAHRKRHPLGERQARHPGRHRRAVPAAHRRQHHAPRTAPHRRRPAHCWA
jgi:hypothetical protein